MIGRNELEKTILDKIIQAASAKMTDLPPYQVVVSMKGGKGLKLVTTIAGMVDEMARFFGNKILVRDLCDICGRVNLWHYKQIDPQADDSGK